MKNRAALTALGLSLACAVLAGALWLRLPPSEQELTANFAKAWDFVEGFRSVGGLPWWTPMFLQGTSLAFSWSYMVASLAILLPSAAFGFLVGPKLAVLACAVVGAMGTYAFLARYTGCARTGVIGAALFLLNPSVLTRAADYEHFVVISSLALLPWAFWSLVVFLQKPSSFSAVLFAASYSAVTLAYGKTGLMALPAVVLFGFSEWLRLAPAARPGRRELALAAGAFLVLCVLPNLPALREARFVVMFDLGPFEAWQRAFSTKSPVGWIDRDGWLTTGADLSYAPTTANGGTFLGLGVFAVFLVALFGRVMDADQRARGARTFLSLAFVLYWLSSGPKGVLGGQLFALEFMRGIPDFTIAISWFLFCGAGWAIFRLVPSRWMFRGWIGAVLCLVFYLVPGFRLIEWLPLYSDIRAPFDFSQVTGAVCLIFAAAILVPCVLARVPHRLLALVGGTVLGCLVVIDALPYARPFFKASAERAIFDNYLETQSALNRSAVDGGVQVFSGSYLYLLGPYLTGRPLVSEAFNSYLQLRGPAHLAAAAAASPEFFRTFLNVSGASHVLADKENVDAERLAKFRGMFPTVVENEHFVLFENPNRWADGFVASSFVTAGEDEMEVAFGALDAAEDNLLTIGGVVVNTMDAGWSGSISGGRVDVSDAKASDPAAPFANATAVESRYGMVRFGPAPQAGWLVLNQAWHPDWRAVDRGAQPVARAMGAFPAVRVKAGEEVTFRLVPPVWYPAAILTGLAGWVVAAAFLAIGMLNGALRKDDVP